MNKIFLLVLVKLSLFSCNQSINNSQPNDSQTKSDTIKNNETHTLSSADLKNLFMISDAEKIVGEPAHLSDSTISIQDDVITFNSTFTANASDKSTGKVGNIYFMFEQYPNDTSATRVYNSIKKSNEDHGIKTLHDLGDEAYFHSDNKNFYFILVRKGVKMFRMKVNKITANTSLDAFYDVAKNITTAI